MRACSTLWLTLVIAVSLFAAPLRAQLAYVANEVSFAVSGYSIDPKTGALTPVAGSPFAAGRSPVSLTVDPRGQFAYVANQGSDTVSGYSINGKTGSLMPVPGSPFTAKVPPPLQQA